MKKTVCLFLLILILPIISCSTYSTQNDYKKSSLIKKFRHTGIILRLSNGSKIPKEEAFTNILSWLSIHNNNNKVVLITDAPDSISVFKGPQERFYQLSNENAYLKYKSIGVLNLYLQNNKTELMSLISKYNLDSLVIYEVHSIFSTEMQFMEFESVFAAVDATLNIAYIDHQTDYFETDSTSNNEIKNKMMDKITGRFIEKLYDLDIIGGEVGVQKINISRVKATESQQGIKPAEAKTDTSKETAAAKPQAANENPLKPQTPKDNNTPKGSKKDEYSAKTENTKSDKAAEKPAEIKKAEDKKEDIKQDNSAEKPLEQNKK